MTRIAVLTGDLVASGRQTAAQIDRAMGALRGAADGIAGWHPPPRDARFTRFRGDGWQIALHHPRFSLRAAVVLQASLVALGLESRISIGIGPAENLGTADLADAAGMAFELSGKGLDEIGDAWRLAIAGETVLEQDRMIADLLGERMGRWTAAQAEAAALHLSSPSRVMTLHEIGTVLGISPQAVNDRLRGAGGPAIASVLRRWEADKGRQDPAP
jgi:hypothetical protein